MNTELAFIHRRWVIHQAILVLAGIPLLFLSSVPGVIYPGLVLGHLFILIAQSGRDQWATPGRCMANGTTLARGILCFIPLSTLCSISLTNVGWLFLTAALMDGLDGWLARRFQGQSPLGMVLDEEVDALFVLLVTIFIWQAGLAGPWIMAAGWIRPVVQLMKTYWPSSKTAPSRTYPWARMLAGAVFILFPAGILLEAWTGPVLIYIACSLVLFSFTLELIKYYGH